MVQQRDFEAWYGEQHSRLISTLVVVAGDVAMATEAADEAFVRAYERWARVGAMASPGGWTYRTALNALRRHHRRRSLELRLLRRHAVPADWAGLGPASPEDWSTEVWDALRRLPRRERTAMALRYVADMPTTTIGVAMGVAEGTVGSTLHSARLHLAALLGDTDGRSEPVADPSPTNIPAEEATDA